MLSKQSISRFTIKLTTQADYCFSIDFLSLLNSGSTEKALSIAHHNYIFQETLMPRFPAEYIAFMRHDQYANT